MHKKQLLIGFLVGLIANAAGFISVILLFGGNHKQDNFLDVVNAAISEGFIGKLVSLGAILNVIVFFIFIKKKQDYHARGVLLATMLIAIFTLLVKF